MRPSTEIQTENRGPVRFHVDDVTPSTEVLPTSELLSVMHDKLGRTVVTSPLEASRVVQWDTFEHPLVAAVHLAFSRHLPLTLSPDAIWLTILQGFRHHVNEHAEALRGRLVRHQGQRKLVEEIEELNAKGLSAAVCGFSRQIKEATDPALYDALICNFTTTTADVRTASEIVFMDTYSQYFRYTVMICVCGIPYVTLTGSVEDWQRIRDRIELFQTFGLGWWVSRLRPVLDEFVRSAAGKCNREFWRGIYKFRPPSGAYHPAMVTGWLVYLFPYLGDTPKRKRSPVFQDKNQEVAAGAFPSGLCKVDVLVKVINNKGRELAGTNFDLVAGMFGVEQSADGISPMISWCLADHAVPENVTNVPTVLSLLEEQVIKPQKRVAAPPESGRWLNLFSRFSDLIRLRQRDR